MKRRGLRPRRGHPTFGNDGVSGGSAAALVSVRDSGPPGGASASSAASRAGEIPGSAASPLALQTSDGGGLAPSAVARDGSPVSGAAAPSVAIDRARARASEAGPRPRAPNERGVALWDTAVRLARGLAVGFWIAFFWSGAFAFAWFVVPYVYLKERDSLARRRRMQRVVAASWRWFHRRLERASLFRCVYEGVALADGAAVLVANHPSLLDVTAVIARMPHVCCVVKGSLMRSALVGRLLRGCGHVAAGDGSLMGGIDVFEQIRERLDEGFPVLIFPEGTRSPMGGMRRFRRGAFEIAKRAGAPIVPLFLRCEPPALGKGIALWRHPRRCPTLTVQVEAQVDTSDRDPVALCKNIEADFRFRLGLADASREQHS